VLRRGGAPVVQGAEQDMKRRIDLARRAEIGAEKRARTRATILSACFGLLGREQGRSTRIDEVIDAAGVSRGTFYNYFSSTDDLFGALCHDISHDFNDAVITFVNTLPRASDRCAAAMRYYLDRAISDPPWGWAMVNISAAGPIFGAETFAHATHSIQEGIDSGEFRLTDPALGRDMMLGTVFASMITLLRGDRAADYPAEVARQVLSALGVKAPRIEQAVARSLPDPQAWLAAQLCAGS
jgi:AcrR family transcriptional regulator